MTFPPCRRAALLAGALALSAALAAPAAAADETPTTKAQATAELFDREGNPIGLVELRETPGGVLIKLGAGDLSPGVHGFHIHETGDCGTDGEGFAAAGGHFAPNGHAHGFLTEDGPHAGDLPNIFVHGDGTVSGEVHNTRVTLAGAESRANLLDDDGAAFVIHAEADDYRSQPSGGGGDRIACGVIETSG